MYRSTREIINSLICTNFDTTFVFLYNILFLFLRIFFSHLGPMSSLINIHYQIYKKENRFHKVSVN